MKSKQEAVVFLKPYLDYRQPMRPKIPLYQKITNWLTRSKPL